MEKRLKILAIFLAFIDPGSQILASIFQKPKFLSPSNKSTIISVLFFAGFFLGAFQGGFISDNYGRKTALLVGAIGNISFSLAASFAPNWWCFAIFRFFIGAFSNTSYVACFVFIMEVIGPKYRSPCGIWVQGFFAIGYGLLSLTAYLFPDWRAHQRALAVVPVPIIFIYFIISESPRYLVAHNRVSEAIQTVKKIGKKNGCDKNELSKIDVIFQELQKSEAENGNKTYSMIDLFKQSRFMTLMTLNLMFNWMVNSITYYGLSLNSAALPTNIYLSNFLYAVIELPSYAVFGFLIETKMFGRKGSLAWALLVGGICTLL